MKRISYLGLFLMICFLGLAFLKPKAPIEENRNVFSSHIYSHYRQQLHEQMGIEMPHGDLRLDHEKWIMELRKQLPSSKSDDLVKWIYLEADLKPAMQEFFYQQVPPMDNDLLSYLEEAQTLLKENTFFDGIKHESDQEDLLLHGNLPSVLFTVSKTQVIRLGHPLNSCNWWSKPSVYPEFIRFLQLQPSHLYVNLMKRHGVEGNASHTLEELENGFPFVYVITLDKNSKFYKQDSRDYPEEMSSDSFKTLFHTKLVDKKGNYYWSKHLVAWSEELNKILNQVMMTYFPNQKHLNRHEREDFIELTYLAILDRLIEKWEPASMNITCRQCMDRAPSLTVLWMYQKKQFRDRDLAALLLTPPLIFHNRPSQTAKIDRFISAARRIK